jgi:hypothetical protein
VLIGTLKFRETEKEVTNSAYWHPKIRKTEKEVTNVAYWRPKIQENRKRGHQ